MTVVVVNKLCRTYGQRRGIQNVNLQIGDGEIFGFLGPNGAGKTTTIRLLLGFLKPDSGLASIFSQDCWTHSQSIKRDVGYVAGDVRLYPWLTTRKGLRIVGQIRGLNLMDEGFLLAEKFRLEPDLPVRKMSRGNRQKVALVLALAHRPKLVILDEPTSGLDPLMQDTLCQCLREMAAEGRTVLFSSHTLSEVESLCDRVAMIRDGMIVVDDSLRSLQNTAPRLITVTLSAMQSFESIGWPSFLTLIHQTGRVCQFRMNGSAAEFVGWAAGQNFDDISIGSPSLDTLFRSYYEFCQEEN